MRFLIASSDYKPRLGGIAEFMFQVARHLAASQHEVHILSPQLAGMAEFDGRYPELISHRSPFAPQLRLLSAKSALLSPRILFNQIRQTQGLASELQQLICNHRIQCLICFLWNPHGVAAARVCRRLGVPYFVVGHGTELFDWNGSKPWRLRDALRWQGLQWKLQSQALLSAAGCLANSDYTADIMRRNSRPDMPCHVTYCGVDSAEFRPEPRKPLLRQKLALGNRTILLTLGRLVRRKGIDHTLRALRLLLQRWSDAPVHYLIAGTGPDEERLRLLVKELDLIPYVSFVGKIGDEEKVDYLNLADVFIMASRVEGDSDYEGFGIVLAEASSCGKPLIAGRSGGIPSIVQHEHNGLLVDPLSPEEISRAIERLIRDDRLAARLGQNGRAVVEAKFQWRHVADRFISAVEPAMRERAEL